MRTAYSLTMKRSHQETCHWQVSLTNSEVTSMGSVSSKRMSIGSWVRQKSVLILGTGVRFHMNKSFPAHIRFFKRLKLASAVISLLAVSGPGITAQELSQDDMALVEMVRERTNTTNLNLDAIRA